MVGACHHKCMHSASICDTNECADTVEGGTIAGNARKELEEKIGRSVILSLNAQSPNMLDVSDEA